MTKLPDDLERLLDGERERSELSPDALESAWSALEASVRKVDAGAPADALPADAPPADAPPAAQPPPAQPVGDAPTSALPTAASWTARALWVGTTAVAFGTGVLVGRATSPLPNPPPPAPVVVSVTPSATSEIAPARSSAAEPVVSAAPMPRPHVPTLAPTLAPALAPSSATKNVPPAASSAPAAPTVMSTLAEERALVEGARTALLRGRAGDALALAERHQSSFPDGGFAEDRDFLIATALRDLGRTEESRAKATAFVARYPKSALRGAALAMTR